jgi:hypothetical protein
MQQPELVASGGPGLAGLRSGARDGIQAAESTINVTRKAVQLVPKAYQK